MHKYPKLSASGKKQVKQLIRAAALISGDGSKLQSILDAIYFSELPEMELVAVISPEKESNAMKRALSFNIPSYVVDPDLFPNITSHSMAVANKLKDMDIELVILAGYSLELGVIPYQFRNRIIGTYPSLIPAFDDIPDGNIFRAALERGIKVTGATAYFADCDGRVGNIILQKTVNVQQDDSPETLARRILEEAEWTLLPEAVSLYCQGRLSVHGNRIVIADK